MVPEAIVAWNPESAPHAIVTKRNGNRAPLKTGPSSRNASSEKAGAVTSGRTTTMPMASSAIVPIFINVDR